MAIKSKILYIANRIPYPPNKGDKIRSFNEIKYLSKNHEIHLAALVDDPDDFQYETDLKKYCQKIELGSINPIRDRILSIFLLPIKKSISVAYFYSYALQKKIDRLLQQNAYDAIICFSSPMAEYLFSSSSWSLLMADKTRLIMDFCDLDSDKWRQYSNQVKSPLNLVYNLESKLLLKYEKKVNRAFDHSAFVSKQEADLFTSLIPEASDITVIPNGVDHQYFSSGKCNKKNNSPILLFTGAMDYYANVDGVTWFSQDIFPEIKKVFPNICFNIVGSNPSAKVKELEKIEGVQVTGFVEDIRPFYAMADVCVVPLRIARGVQNKVLEAMSMGKPVVTTSAAIQGITGAGERELIVADDSKDFAEAIHKLLQSENKRQKLSYAGRSFVVQNYDWQTNMTLFEALLTN